ncbi:MAG: long-chain fatty acid--CoA ligase [Spirochaetes bacterium]|nr:MAG: long-chain fatty acid--CoA ligase [Spirochaetota bacterium]
MREYTLDKPDNLVEMFEDTLSRFGDREWLGTKNKKTNSYEWVSYREAAKKIDAIRGGLAKIGVKKGDGVAIIDNNSVEWAACCYASYGLGARFIPMYKAELLKIWNYILTDSGTRVLFVRDQEIFDKVKNWTTEIESLKNIFLIEGTGPDSLAELEKLGADNPVPAIHPGPEDIAGLIYTSGTTGEPKGVLLSHANFSSNVHACLKNMPMLDQHTRTLSFLPWAHSYGQTAELNTLMRMGGSCGFAESAQTIVDDLGLVKPTLLVAVPRIFNRVYDGLHARMNDEGGLAKTLFFMGKNSGQKKRDLAREGKSSFLANLKFAIADKIVFSKVRARFGGNLKMTLSSSAALSPNIAEFFFDIGLPIYEAWGMTEISPAGSANSPLAYKIGSVGKALDKVTFAIDKTETGPESRDGELVVYGPNVMKGYHNKPKETAETMTQDGGLRTGDRAYIDDDGFLYITGRIKEQFKLENGKFVYPAAIEEEIKLIPLVEFAMVYGLNMPYTVVLVYPDFLVLQKFAKENNLPEAPAELIKEEKVVKLFENTISGQLKGKFGSYEVPKKILLMAEGFSVENGMLTQTLKLKRRAVLQKYQSDINRLYQTK